MEVKVRIPGYQHYYITPGGNVYYNGNTLKVPIKKPNQALKIRIQENGICRLYGLATLIAKAFIPNPNQYKKVIFKDGNKYNCHAGNIEWVSNVQFSRYSLHPGMPLHIEKKPKPVKQPKPAGENRLQHVKQKPSIPQLPDDPLCAPIPGFPGYYINPSGEVYSKSRLLKIQKKAGKADRIKLVNKNRKAERHSVAWFIAVTFIPNPNNHTKIIFKDRDKTNYAAGNIEWVSALDFKRHYYSCDLLGEPVSKKVKDPVFIDPKRVPVEGYEGYFITPKGVVYKGDKMIKPVIKKGRSLKVRLRRDGTLPATYSSLGIATLLAMHFIPNPKNHKYIIFKDRNNQNCTVENIAWVDAQTFVYYCGLLTNPGKRKIVIEREQAIKTCTHPLLRQYYKTLDKYWLHECWKEVQQKMYVSDWQRLAADCYLYFIDRAKRFSILKDPAGLIMLYMKGVRSKLKKEISDDIPYSLLVTTDESMRNRKFLQDQ